MRGLLLLLCLLSLSVQSQEQDTFAVNDSTGKENSSVNSKTILLPLLWFLPETSLGFGGVAIKNFKAPGQLPSHRSSSLQLGIAYTLNKQFLSYLPFSVYLDQDRWYTQGEFGFYDYFYRYFGIGNETLNEAEETFGNRFTRIKVDGYRRAVPNLYVGFNFSFDHNKIKDLDPDGALINEDLAGLSGGRFLSFGPALFWDSRNGIHAPSKGMLIELASTWSGNFIGSEFSFNRQYVSFAKYIELKPSQVLALNAVSETTQGRVPFNYLPDLGGGNILRGFTNGRFRDNNLIYAQAEYRLTFSKKDNSISRFGMVAYIGAGKVYQEQMDLLENLHLNLGTGARFALDEKERLNLRFDLAFGKESWGFYFIAGEAF